MAVPRVGKLDGRSLAAVTKALRADPALRREAIKLLRSDLMQFLDQSFTLSARDRALISAVMSKSDAKAIAGFYIQALEDPSIKVSYRRTFRATPGLAYRFSMKSRAPGTRAGAAGADTRTAAKKEKDLLDEARHLQETAKKELEVEMQKTIRK